MSEVAHAKNGSDVEEIRNKTHIKGFNSIFAVSSVEAAKLYYTEFQKQMAAHPEKAIKIATIYSFAPNESEADGLLGEEDSATALPVWILRPAIFWKVRSESITSISAPITIRRQKNSPIIIKTYPCA